MSGCIPDMDTAKLLGQFFLDHLSVGCSFMKVLICMNKTLGGRLRGLKTKEKSSWIVPKVFAVAYRSDCVREHYKVPEVSNPTFGNQTHAIEHHSFDWVR